MDGEYLGHNRLKVIIVNLIFIKKYNGFLFVYIINKTHFLYIKCFLLFFSMKLGFGKSMPSTCVWLDGLTPNITEQYITRQFLRFGHVVKVSYSIFLVAYGIWGFILPLFVMTNFFFIGCA